MFNRMDLSLIQDVFANIGGKRNAGQFRLDITNFGNLLNHNWGVIQRMVVADDRGQRRADPDQRRLLDAQGRVSYRMAVVNNELAHQVVRDGHRP